MTRRIRGGQGLIGPVPPSVVAPPGARSFEAGAAVSTPRPDVQDGDMHSTHLPNGIQVLTEHVPGVRSAAVGVWVRQGSANEPGEHMGVSHMLEHMVFKGTARRTPREIALALESLGGSLDAYTSREQTSFQARILDEHVPVALEVLADLVLEPNLRDQDLELERDVVLEEIAMVEDTPDDLVFELHGERLWGGHPYGHAILGTRETVSAMDGETLRDLHRRSYQGKNLVVAAAGNVEHDETLGRVESLFGRLSPGTANPTPANPVPSRIPDLHVERDGAQTHVVFGGTIPGHSDPARYPLVLLSSALGAGMSSRLFQRIREELALCYTVFSYQSFYRVGGVTGVYVGTRPEWADRAVDAVRAELADVARNGLPDQELAQIKQQVKGHLMLSLESTGARLHRLAGFALHEQPFASLEEILARIDAVDGAQIQTTAERHMDPEVQTVLTLGPGRV